MTKKLLTVLLLLLFYSSFLFHKINLVTADLGRHLKNGEIFFQTGKILATNFYSYTEPNFPVINHHWGAGVIFFLVSRLGGFVGLQLFFIVLSLAAFLIFFYLAQRKIGVEISALVSILAIPLLAERTEVRPEVFTYLFSGIFLLLIILAKEEKISFDSLFVLPFIQILWVNLHVFWFLGPLILFLFLVREKRLLPIFILTLLSTLLNPFGIKGVLYPATILNSYGYTIIENQPLWFIEKLVSDPNFTIFKIAFGVLVVSFVLAFNKTKKIDLSLLILSVSASFLAWFQIRNFALFGFIFLPIVATNLSQIYTTKESKYGKFVILALTFIIVLIHSEKLLNYFPYWREAGLGLETGNENSIKFLMDNDIKGPILNDYDVGSYLIYYLFPKEKVFVDNRPEAYSVSFFKDTYVPMLEDEKIWKKEDEKYKFNAIVFSITDATPWGQKFLSSRVSDKNWTVAYADKYTIIFVRKK